MKLTVEKLSSKLGKKIDHATATSLDLSKQGLTELGSFARCVRLESIDLSGNLFQKFEQIQGVFEAPRLKEVNLAGNAVIKRAGFRESCIKYCSTLEVINGERVKPEERKTAVFDAPEDSSDDDDDASENEANDAQPVITTLSPRKAEPTEPPMPLLQATTVASAHKAPVEPIAPTPPVESDSEDDNGDAHDDQQDDEDDNENEASVQPTLVKTSSASTEDAQDDDDSSDSDAAEVVTNNLDKVKEMYTRGADADVSDDILNDDDDDDLLGDDDDKPKLKTNAPAKKQLQSVAAQPSSNKQHRTKLEADLANYIKTNKEESNKGLFDD